MLKSVSDDVKMKGFNMPKDVRITIRIPEQLKVKIQQVANELNISFNDAIKTVLFSGLK